MASIIFKIPARYGNRRGGCIPGEQALLERLGFPSRRAYLKSDLWRVVSGAKLAADPKCKCGQPAEHVIIAYFTSEALTGRSQQSLRSVCRKCCRWR